MNLISLLAKLHDMTTAAYRRLPPRQKIMSWLLALIAVLAIAADFMDAGEMLAEVFGRSRQANAELAQIMVEMSADRALLTRFDAGYREAVASVAQGGKPEVSKANQFTSLSVHPYDVLYREHKAGRCWSYSYDLGQRKHILDDGMARAGARSLLSCPVRGQGLLLGALSVSYDEPLDIAVKARKQAQLQRLAQGLGKYLD
jgi:GAF domain-containing protein